MNHASGEAALTEEAKFSVGSCNGPLFHFSFYFLPTLLYIAVATNSLYTWLLSIKPLLMSNF